MRRLDSSSSLSWYLFLFSILFTLHATRGFPASSVSEDLDDPRQQVRLLHFGLDPFVSSSPLHAKQLTRTFHLSPSPSVSRNSLRESLLERLLRGTETSEDTPHSTDVAIAANAFGELPSYMTKDWAQVGQELNSPWRLFGVPRYALIESINRKGNDS